MGPNKKQDDFLKSFKIVKNDIVSVVGAGGKTSLIFRLAAEARQRGFKTLVTTTTHMLIPRPEQYDGLDLSGALFSETAPSLPGIYVGGAAAGEQEKMRGASPCCLENTLKRFDLVLIEADGAAGKALKGWKESEPVIPRLTTKTIGVVDIQTIGCPISPSLIHRLDIFLKLTGTIEKEYLTVEHLCRIISSEKGLFSKSQGEVIIFINKLESDTDRKHAAELVGQLEQRAVVCGSIRHARTHVLP